ncbi:MAG: AEC family transporter [Clostridia bacterium]|nr:AEC family transporter [Clostridia bacterium]
MVEVILMQSALMFLFMAIGFLLYKTKKITEQGSKTIANILVYAVLPAVIVKSFCKAPTAENMSALGISALLGLGALLISIIVSRLFFSDAPLDEFASAFSNVGFFGIPLIQATPLGNDGVFYIATIVALVNVGQWTYGVMRLTQKSVKETFSPVKLLTSPFIIATLVGLLLFFTGIGDMLYQIDITKKVVFGVIDGLSVVNTPLAMMIIGVYLAQTDLKTLFTTKATYTVSMVRLIVIPLVVLLVFWLVPHSLEPIKTAVFIAISCPVGSNVAVYAELHGKDYSHAVKTVTSSSIFSIITMPLLIMLAGLIF